MRPHLPVGLALLGIRDGHRLLLRLTSVALDGDVLAQSFLGSGVYERHVRLG